MVGGAIGSNGGNTGTGALIGAGIGLAAGSIIGYFAHKDPKTSKSDLRDIPNSTPSMTSPEVNRIWVPDKIEGNKYIKGHFIYLIQKESVWSEE